MLDRGPLSERSSEAALISARTVIARIALVGLAGFALSCGVSTQGTRTVPPEGTPPPAPPTNVPGEPAQPTLPPQPPPGTQTDMRYLRYRYTMDSPANDDFTVELPEIFLYVRPFEDYISMKVQGRNQNRVPSPSSLSYPISPPIIFTSDRQMESPSPLPPCLRAVLASAC